MSEPKPPAQAQPSKPARSLLAIPLVRVFVYVMLVGALMMGGWILVREVRLNARAQDFVEVEGVVATSRLESRGDRDDFANLQATYTYEGQQRRTTLTVARGVEGEQELSGTELIERHPQGSPIAVFVNPDDPEEAVFARHNPPGKGIFTVVLMALLLGVVVRADVRRIARAER